MNPSLPPLTVPLATAHEYLGAGSRTQFRKVFIDTGLITPVDMGGRGLSVLVDDLKTVVEKRAAAMKSGELVVQIRSARGKRNPTPAALPPQPAEATPTKATGRRAAKKHR